MSILSVEGQIQPWCRGVDGALYIVVKFTSMQIHIQGISSITSTQAILQLSKFPGTIISEIDMSSSPRILTLAACFACLLFSPTIVASPFEYDQPVDVTNFGLNAHKRQDPSSGGDASDPSGIDPEDEDAAQIAADGTGPLRKGNFIMLGSF